MITFCIASPPPRDATLRVTAGGTGAVAAIAKSTGVSLTARSLSPTNVAQSLLLLIYQK